MGEGGWLGNVWKGDKKSAVAINGELFLDVLQSVNGVDHTGVRHARPLQSLQLFVPRTHLPEIPRNSLGQLAFALL